MSNSAVTDYSHVRVALILVMRRRTVLRVARGVCIPLLAFNMIALIPSFNVAQVKGQVYTPHNPIVIQSNSDFVASNGVVSGSGTGSAPYMIQGWDINASGVNGITIVGTTAFFVVKNVNIHQGIRGVFFQNAANGGITSSSLTDNQNSIIVDHSTSIAVNGTAISNNVNPISWSGVKITNSTNITVSSDTFSGRWLGSAVTIAYSREIKVLGNGIATFSTGVYAQYSSLITISQNTISNGQAISIDFSMSSNSTVSNNNVTRILAEYSDTISIIGNTVRGGVDLSSSSHCTISNNNFRGGGLITGSDPGTHTILPNNVVNGKPLYYYKDCTGTSLDGVPVGQLIMVGCRGIRVANLQIVNASDAIHLVQVKGALLLNNNISNNTQYGVRIDSSSYLVLVGNNIKFNGWGLSFGETMIPQSRGVPSSFVSVVGNTISRNACGLCGLETVSNVTIYHNNFLNNTGAQVNGLTTLLLDNGYPTGGNYWSDYVGVDNCSGPSQNICPNPDGIGDSPFSPETGLKDRFPLIKPYAAPSDPSAPSWPGGSSLTSSGVDSTSVSLSWPGATDSVEVIAYRIYNGNTIVAYVPGQYHFYTVTNLTPGTTYTFKIEAGNAADHWSQTSLGTVVTTSNPLLIELTAVALGLAGLSATLVVWRLRRRRHLRSLSGTLNGPPPEGQLLQPFTSFRDPNRL